MEADTSGGLARYRCRLSGGDYARNEALDRSHPRSAAVGEAEGDGGRSTAGWAPCSTRSRPRRRSGVWPERATNRTRDGGVGRQGASPGAGVRREVGEVPGGARRRGRPRGDWRVDRRRASGAGVSGARRATPPRRSRWVRPRWRRWWRGSRECADRFTRAMAAATPEARQALYDAHRPARVLGSGCRCGGQASLAPAETGGSWCRRGDLNPHALFGHQALNLARLPIPPLRRGEEDHDRPGPEAAATSLRPRAAGPARSR